MNISQENKTENSVNKKKPIAVVGKALQNGLATLGKIQESPCPQVDYLPCFKLTSKDVKNIIDNILANIVNSQKGGGKKGKQKKQKQKKKKKQKKKYTNSTHNTGTGGTGGWTEPTSNILGSFQYGTGSPTGSCYSGNSYIDLSSGYFYLCEGTGGTGGWTEPTSNILGSFQYGTGSPTGQFFDGKKEGDDDEGDEGDDDEGDDDEDKKRRYQNSNNTVLLYKQFSDIILNISNEYDDIKKIIEENVNKKEIINTKINNLLSISSTFKNKELIKNLTQLKKVVEGKSNKIKKKKKN